MITVVFKNIIIDEKINFGGTESVYIELSGHSGFDIKGSDIVCSAASILMHTFTQAVGRILKIRQQIERTDGFFSTLIMKSGISADDGEKLKLLIEFLLIGFMEINSEYPDKIKIEFVND